MTRIPLQFALENAALLAQLEAERRVLDAVDRVLACSTYVDAGLRSDVAEAIRNALKDPLVGPLED